MTQRTTKQAARPRSFLDSDMCCMFKLTNMYLAYLIFPSPSRPTPLDVMVAPCTSFGDIGRRMRLQSRHPAFRTSPYRPTCMAQRCTCCAKLGQTYMRVALNTISDLHGTPSAACNQIESIFLCDLRLSQSILELFRSPAWLGRALQSRSTGHHDVEDTSMQHARSISAP